MKKLSITAVAALTVLALASCGKSIDTNTTAKAPAASSSSPTSSEPGNFQTPDSADLETTEAEETETPAAPDSIRFGETWTWEDGTAVTVSKPKKFTPSTYAATTGKFKTHVMFTITVKNGSKEKLELFSTPTLVSGDTEAGDVFDTDKGLEGTPDSKVQPGRTVKFKVGYGVKDFNDLVMEYAPTFDHDEATFTSK